ncbi:MAG: TrmH family RNA methyltransferase [Chlamydiia bacterium]
MLIESLQNPRVKGAIHLRDRRDRDRDGKFLIEGYREVRRALDNGWAIEQLFFAPSLFLGSTEKKLLRDAEAQGALLLETSAPVFHKLSYRDRPDGLLAVAPQRRISLEQLPVVDNPLWVIAEGIEKPGNLGTILRSADAVGATGLIVCDPQTDLYNPNVVRASVGTLFSVPTVTSSSEETMTWLRAQGCRIVAATPHATEVCWEAPLTGPVAIAFGTEQLGLSAFWMEAADLPVKIPMLGSADSLNVAMAATVLLYEVMRQRAGSHAKNHRK